MKKILLAIIILLAAASSSNAGSLTDAFDFTLDAIDGAIDANSCKNEMVKLTNGKIRKVDIHAADYKTEDHNGHFFIYNVGGYEFTCQALDGKVNFIEIN